MNEHMCVHQNDAKPSDLCTKYLWPITIKSCNNCNMLYKTDFDIRFISGCSWKPGRSNPDPGPGLNSDHFSNI